MVDIYPRLPSLAPRPPTPPRERTKTTPKFNQDSIHSPAKLSDILDCLESSPPSSAEYSKRSSEKASKRVVFSPWTKYHKPPGDNGTTYSSNDQIRILPPSKDCKSSKSILKPYPGICKSRPMGQSPTLGLNGDFTTMLESATQHLASLSRNSRVDAYTALLGCFGAYSGILHIRIVSDKLAELLRCIRRDILATTEGNGFLDTQLVTQALKLLTILISKPDLVRSVPDDFCAFIVEQSIASLEDQTLPKIVVTHYMHFIGEQKLPQQYMNADRMNRLVTVLDCITSSVKGNRVIAQRLMVYKRLLSQAKPAMILCGKTWIGHLISGMLSTFKDIRLRAIIFGTEAGLLLGTTRSVSQAFIDTLNRESPEGRKVVDFLASRLMEITNSKDDGHHVPQMWSIAILFLRSRPYQLEGWQHLKPWLLIIQKCFNSSDTQMKFQANLAWSRLIFAVNLDPSTSLSMIKMLRQPIMPQLDRKSDLRANKTSKHNKQIARSSYCTLLYYAFRPSATFAQYDQYWDKYILEMLPSDLSTNILDIDYSCDILTALFSSRQPKVWDENRANVNGLVKADELPCIDPKWVRSRAVDILKVFERLFPSSDWQSRKDQEAPILSAWRSFATAIGDAGRKEVKVSMETMSFIAQMLNLIKQVWLRDLKQKDAVGISNVLERINSLFNEAILKIGLIPFNEKRLTQSSQNSYEATETPSSRSSGRQGPSISPFQSLINLLVSTLEDCHLPSNFENVVEHLLNLSVQATNSRRTQIGMLRDFMRVIPFDGRPYSKSKTIFWQLIAKSTESVFKSSKARDTHDNSDRYAGHDYEDAIKIMETGILLRSAEINLRWQDLGGTLVQSLEQEIGNEVVLPIVLEPLAGFIIQSQPCDCDEFLLDFAVFLLESTKWSDSRHEKERSNKSFWGMSPVAHKQSSLGSFSALSSMTGLLLRNSYAKFELISQNKIIRFFSAVTSMIKSCPPSLSGELLKQIQKGVATWIEDSQELLAYADNTTDVYNRVKILWSAISESIKTLPKIDSQVLSLLSVLIACSLNSRQKAITDESILLWNSTFGLVEGLKYPSTLQPVLLRLKRTHKSIYLPNFPEYEDAEAFSLSMPNIDSYNDKEMTKPNGCSTPISTIPSPSHKIDNGFTPKSSKGFMQPQEIQRLKTPSKGRSRQNDAEIQFSAVESSPISYKFEESKPLPDQQKEVSEHQERGAVTVLPNLTPSPKLKSRPNGEAPPKLTFQNIQNSHFNRYTNNESPTLPIKESSNYNLESSPTPMLSRKSSEDCHSERQSSSPSAKQIAAKQGFQINDELVVSNSFAQRKLERQGDDLNRSDNVKVNLLISERQTVALNYLDHDSDQSLETHWDETALTEHISSSSYMEQLNAIVNVAHSSPKLQDCFGVQLITLPINGNNISEKHASCIHNPTIANEISTDTKESSPAPTLHGPLAVPYPQGGSEVEAKDAEMPDHAIREDITMGPFEEARASCLSNEDDQIAAQIVRDMEQNFSQIEFVSKGSSPVCRPENIKGKRKNTLDVSESPSKKLKVTPQNQNFQILVEVRNPKEMDGIYVTSEKSKQQKSIPQKTKHRQTRSQSKTMKVSSGKSSAQKSRKRSMRSLNSKSSSAREAPATRRTSFLDSDMESRLNGDVPDPMSSLVGKGRRPRHLNLSTENSRGLQERFGEDIVYDEKDPQRMCVAGDPLVNGGQEGCERAPEDPRQEKAIDAVLIRDPSHSMESAQPNNVRDEPTGKIHEYSAHMEETQNRSDTYPPGSVDAFTTSMQESQGESRSAKPEALISEMSCGSRIAPTNPLGDVSTILDKVPRVSGEKNPLVYKILDSFKGLLGDLRRVALGPVEEKEMIDLLCHSLQEVHEAGRRKKSVSSGSTTS